MDNRLKKMACAGYAAKGIVYLIVGVLTLLAALNMGGQKMGKFKIIGFLNEQAFGAFLLIFMALGLLCYSVWRFIQAIGNPENIKPDATGIFTRIGYFLSGTIYLSVVFLAFKSALGPGGSGSGGMAQKSSLFSSNIGLIVLGIVGLIIIIRGVRQFIKVYKKSYMNHFDFKAIHEEKRRKTIHNSAKIGLSARGIMFLIIGYFALKAVISSDPNEIKTTTDAFAFLQSTTSGPWLFWGWWPLG